MLPPKTVNLFKSCFVRFGLLMLTVSKSPQPENKHLKQSSVQNLSKAPISRMKTPWHVQPESFWLQLRSLRNFPKTPAVKTQRQLGAYSSCWMWIWEIQQAFPKESISWKIPNLNIYIIRSFQRFLKQRYSTWCFGWVGRVRSWLSSWRTAWPSLTPLRLRPLGWWDHVPVAYQPWDAACPAMRRFSTESLEKCEGEGDNRKDGWRMMRMMRMMMFHSILLFLSPPRKNNTMQVGGLVHLLVISQKMPLCHSWPFLWYASFTHTAGKCHSCIQLQWQ